MPSLDRKSGIPHDTDTPAPVKTRILLDSCSSLTTSSKVFRSLRFFLLGVLRC
uniref:Uncharacterized protein n=1 Tax=Anguilla anguilla TaxID=7936 RepID=A0A0E9UID7_ANGAN